MRIIRETSVESYNEIKDKLSARHKICIENLEELGEATANDLATVIYEKGITPYFDRNFVHPRLNELVGLGLIKIVGKKKDKLTNRNCIVYEVV